jgi:hypothetical protein
VLPRVGIEAARVGLIPTEALARLRACPLVCVSA